MASMDGSNCHTQMVSRDTQLELKMPGRAAGRACESVKNSSKMCAPKNFRPDWFTNKITKEPKLGEEGEVVPAVACYGTSPALM